jgi:hypothetical protein
MFLPSEIGDRIAGFRYRDNSGRERDLVKSIDVIHRSENRPLPLDEPRDERPRNFLLSLCVGALLCLLAAFREKRCARVALGLSQALLGLFFGVAGFLTFFMSFFTNHDYTYNNMNLFFVNPLLLAAVPLGLLYAFSADPFRGNFRMFLLKILWSYVAAGGVFSMLLRIMPRFWQQNGATLALVLPVATALSFAPDLVRRFRQRYLWRYRR